MGSIRLDISGNSLIILRLSVYSETLESSLNIRAALDTGASRTVIPPNVAKEIPQLIHV